MKRRGFFASMLTPLIARCAPKRWANNSGLAAFPASPARALPLGMEMLFGDPKANRRREIERMRCCRFTLPHGDLADSLAVGDYIHRTDTLGVVEKYEIVDKTPREHDVEFVGVFASRIAYGAAPE